MGLRVEVEGPDECWAEELVCSVTALCPVGASLGLEAPQCHAVPGRRAVSFAGFEGDRLGMALTVELLVPGQPLSSSGLCDELLFRSELVAASSAQVLPLCLLAASSGLSLVQKTK